MNAGGAGFGGGGGAAPAQINASLTVTVPVNGSVIGLSADDIAAQLAPRILGPLRNEVEILGRELGGGHARVWAGN